MPSTCRFRITASPCLGGEAQDELTHVDFNATDSQGEKRSWRVDRQRLMSLFDVLEPSQAASDVIVQLSAGSVVTIPGTYNAVNLVQLGFRTAPAKRRQEDSLAQVMLEIA